MAGHYPTSFYPPHYPGHSSQQQQSAQSAFQQRANATHQMAAAAATAAALAASQATGQTAAAAATIPYNHSLNYDYESYVFSQVHAAQTAQNAANLQHYYSQQTVVNVAQPTATAQTTQVQIGLQQPTAVPVTGTTPTNYAHYLAMTTNSASTQAALMAQVNLTTQPQQTILYQPQYSQYPAGYAAQPAPVHVPLAGPPLTLAAVPPPPQQQPVQHQPQAHYPYANQARPPGHPAQRHTPNEMYRRYDGGPLAQLRTAAPNAHRDQKTSSEDKGSYALTMRRNTGQSANKNASEKLKLPSQLEMRFCDLCKVECISLTNYQQHITGKRHQQKLKQLEDLKAGRLGVAFKGTIEKAASTAADIADSKSSADSKATTTEETSASSASTIAQSLSMKNVNLERMVKTKSAAVLLCRLCNAMCVSVDAYKGHIMGAKHAKVRTLAQQKNEPIPSLVPDFISKNVAPSLKQAIIDEFVRHEAMLNKDPKQRAQELANMPGPGSTRASEELSVLDQSDFAQPVGQDFIEEVINETGKIVCFMCTLCEVRFNDDKAKEMHLKGKKHRIAFKKKVDPHLLVADIKADRCKLLRQRELKNTRKRNLENLQYAVDINLFDSNWTETYAWNITDYLEDLQTFKSQHLVIRYLYRTMSDKLLEERHNSVVAQRCTMERIYTAVSLIEVAAWNLATVLDQIFFEFSDDDSADVRAEKSLKINMEAYETLVGSGELVECIRAVEEEAVPAGRLPSSNVIKLVRVGILGKGYVLEEDDLVEVVLLCNFFPTENLLQIFVEMLPKILNKAQEDFRFEVEREEAGFVMMATALAADLGANLDNPEQSFRIQVRATFASGFIRNTDPAIIQDMVGLLNRELCLDALCEVRRIRWFKDKVATHVSQCMVHPHFQFIVRIIRSIYSEESVYKKLPDYTIELQLERICNSLGFWPPVIVLVRHFFEVLACGILLDKVGIGIGDPCQYNFPDAYSFLSLQERENITTHAQLIVRMIQLGQLFKLISVKPNETRCLPAKRPLPNEEEGMHKQLEATGKNGLEDDTQSTVKRLKTDSPEPASTSKVEENPDHDKCPTPHASNS